MTRDAATNISLHVEGQVLDLRIPDQVSRSRLQELIQEVLDEHPAVVLPRQWELKVMGKHIALGEHDKLKNYPISDGDQFVVISRSRTGQG